MLIEVLRENKIIILYYIVKALFLKRVQIYHPFFASGSRIQAFCDQSLNEGTIAKFFALCYKELQLSFAERETIIICCCHYYYSF